MCEAKRMKQTQEEKNPKNLKTNHGYGGRQLFIDLFLGVVIGRKCFSLCMPLSCFSMVLLG